MNILQVSHYPIANAITGGQRRIRNLQILLRKSGFNVRHIAVCPRRSDLSKRDLALSPLLHEWVFQVPYDFEMRISHAIELDNSFFADVRARLRRAKPSIVWLEHPFLWPVISKCFAKLPVVYSAHNIEWEMKRQTLKASSIFDLSCLESLRATEEDLARRASLVVCCCNDDRKYFASINKSCLTISNGSDPPIVRNPEAAWRELEARARGVFAEPTFTFVSSEHEPNWAGFVDLVVEPLRRHPPTRSMTILLIGNICRFWEPQKQTHGQMGIKVVALPNASEDAKNLALLNSTAVLLPIIQGGGTNLKTAEALLSQSPIIGTRVAFRGFERYVEHAQVFIADSPIEFLRRMNDLAAADRPGKSLPESSASCKSRSDITSDVFPVTWDSIIASTIDDLTFNLRSEVAAGA
jgi:hypothetical protein